MATINAIKNKAFAMEEPFREFMAKHLTGWGSLADQLRVMGYLCEAGLEMAETELKVLKMRDDMARPKVTLN